MSEKPMDDVCKASPTVCGVIDIWEVLGKRWSLLIIKNLRTKETIRFNELKRALSGISSTVLSERLLELELIIKELAKWVGRWKNPAEVTAVQPKKEGEATVS